jgi:hypothetical protein
MTLRPAQVHPQEHLRPVGRLRAAGAGADREQRRARVVLAGEQQLSALPGEVRLERRTLASELRRELRVAGFLDQLEGRQEVVEAMLESPPQLDLAAQAVGLAKRPLRGALVVPEVRFGGQCLELRDARFLRLEVKDAPRSTGSARPGLESRTRPSSCAA